MPATTPHTLHTSLPTSAASHATAPESTPLANERPTLARQSNPGPQMPAAARRLSSRKLFEGRAEIEIEHGESVYRLRQTSLGKLILTK